MKNHRTKDLIKSYLFILPFFTVFGVFLAYPIIYSFYISLHKVTLNTNLFSVFSDMIYVGLDNYRELVNSFEFWWSLIVSLLYMALSIPGGIFLSLLLAVILNNKLKGATFFRSAFFLPNVLDMLVIGLIWKLLYSPAGLFDTVLHKIGISLFSESGLLGDARFALAAVAFAMVIKGVGFGMILFLTALQNISPNIFEAADIDGLSWWQKFFYIQAPLVKPIILFLTIAGIMASLNAFTEFYIMTEGNPVSTIAGNTVGVTKISGYLLFQKFSDLRFGYSAAMSYMLLVFALLVSYLNYKFIREKE